MKTNSEDIFQSSAGYYTAFRKPYPSEIWERISDRFRLDGEGDLLDVGCGTGQIAFPLLQRFRRVVGVDLSQEMIGFARKNAHQQGAENVGFHVMSGEDISQLSGEFSLVTYGSSLHWMDLSKTLAASNSLLVQGGGVAILGMRSIWGGKSDWEQAVVRVVQKWMGQERRAGSGIFAKSVDSGISFADALSDAGFDVFEEDEVEASYEVDTRFILGHLYTTSYCNRDLLGDRVEEFEQELTQELLRSDADGTFTWSPGASYLFARKRG